MVVSIEQKYYSSQIGSFPREGLEYNIFGTTTQKNNGLQKGYLDFTSDFLVAIAVQLWSM